MAKRTQIMFKNSDLFLICYSWLLAAIAWIAALVHWVIGFSVMASVFLTASVSHANVATGVELKDNCDIIELNHIHDGNGCQVFDQLIFWRWDRATSEYHVRAWTIYDSDDKHPIRNYLNDSWSVRYRDSVQSRNRIVTAKHFRESLTQRDPERDNKRILDENCRLDLIKRRSDITIILSEMAE